MLKNWKDTDNMRHKCALRDLDLAGSALYKEAINKTVSQEKYALKDDLVCMNMNKVHKRSPIRSCIYTV